MSKTSQSKELPKMRQSNLNIWISKDSTKEKPSRKIKQLTQALSSSRTLRSQKVTVTTENNKCASTTEKNQKQNPFEKFKVLSEEIKLSSKKPVSKKSSTAPQNKSNLNPKNKSQDIVTMDLSSCKRKRKTFASTRAKRDPKPDDEELPSFSNKQPTGGASETFKRYGIVIPTVDEMLEEQKELDIYRKKVQDALKLDIPKVEFPVTPEKDESQENFLDCKHLTLEEIENHFNKNVDYLTCIMEGKGNSTRHTRYHSKRDFKDTFTTKDLRYNTSTIVFTFKQIDLMATLMRKRFDPEDVKTTYFFQVLIPELCLKVFMDTHDMTKRNAMSYLDKRPIM